MNNNEIGLILDRIIENKNIDLKQGFEWKTKSRATLQIIRDIIAMANTQDGGKLIIGFDEKDKKFTGSPDNWFESFDQTNVSNSVKKYTSSPISLQVQKLSDFSWNKQTGNLIILEIPEFEKNPLITKDGTDSDGKPIFHAGDLLIRTEDASTGKIKDNSQMEELLHRSALKHRAFIIDAMEKISEHPSSSTSHNIEAHDDEIGDFVNTSQNAISPLSLESGIWRLEVMPEIKSSKPFSLADIRHAITKSQVRYRGKPFPIIDKQKTERKERFLETIAPLDHDKNKEYWRLYDDGLFCCMRTMFEDNNADYHGTLSKIAAVWTITEMLIFISRFYSGIIPESENVHLKLTITNCKDRHYSTQYYNKQTGALMRNPVFYNLGNGGKCNSKVIEIIKSIPILNLQTNWESEVHAVMKELDDYFAVGKYNSEFTKYYIDELLNTHLT